MNKIANWVFGSFFRTIGRVLVFILLGFIIAHFIDFGSLKDNFSITDLFLDKVKASGISSTNYFNNAYNSSGTVLNNSLVFGDGQVIAYNNSQTQIYFNNQHAIGGNGIAITSGLQTSYVVFMIAVQSSSEVQQTQQSISIVSRWSRNQGSLVSSSFCDINFYNYEFGRPENQNGSTIYANVYCPVPITNDTLYITRLDIQNNATADVFQTFHINRNITILLNENYILQQGQQGTTNAINEQTQQQQQQHQETQNYLEDTNTTSANSQGESFITNFNNNTHGLTGIITAPLNAIQSIASSTCSTLVLPLPFMQNKSLTLPCMSTIYSQYFGAFYTMYQGIILALISYWVCIRIFTLVKGFKDPDDDKIEVMDL